MSHGSEKLSKGRKISIAILLLIPFMVYMLYPTYDKVNPTLGGLSFFYWYQTMWLAISGLLFGIAAYIWEKR
ncbi:MAG: DUF3311 domain-containing protein [Caldisphaera sp.]|nr:DUF3311 domain-containing protein [Caldisphaera sp.]